MSENNEDWNFLFNPPSDEPYCPYCGARCYHAICWCPLHKRFECIFQRENERDVMRPKRKEALKFFIRELIKSWDELVEEAELHLDEREENYIVYRYALLLFALNRASNSDSRFAKPFKELIRCYLK